MVVTNHTSRLQFMNQGILFSQSPVKILVDFPMIPYSVKPDCSDRSIVGEQLCQLVVHKLVIGIPVSMFGTSGIMSGISVRIIILTRPVKMRIIQMQFDSLLLTFLGKFLDDIPLERSCIYNVIIRIAGIKHGESVMMTGCDANILGS